MSHDVPYHPIHKQLFVRIVGPLSTFASGCLIILHDETEVRITPVLWSEGFKMLPTFIAVASSILGVLLAIFIVGKTFCNYDNFYLILMILCETIKVILFINEMIYRMLYFIHI